MIGEYCPKPAFHTPTPVVRYREWFEAMEKTHRLRQCPGCGRFLVWVKRAERG